MWEIKLSLNPDFGWEPMPDGCLVYRHTTGQVLTLNPAAELILTYCDGAMTIAEIYREISADLAMPEVEFLSVVSQLMKEGVVA